MGHDRTLARGARVFGALLTAALALLSLGWIIRDFTKADEVTDVWWNWAGSLARAEDGIWTTTHLEPMLVLLYAVAAVTAVRSSSASAILTSTGVLTVLLRVPGLWNLNADWLQGVDDGLKSKVLWSTIAMVVLGVALVVTAVAGRRPVDPPDGGYGYGFRPAHDPAEEPPARPARGGAVVAFLALAAAAGVLAAWEIYWWNEDGWDVYQRLLTGERSIVSLLAAPSAWTTWTIALIALVAGVAALAGAPFSRPLGLVISAPLLGKGVFATSLAVKTETFEHLADLTTRQQLDLATGVFEIVAGVAVLLALAPRGERDAYPSPGAPDSPDRSPYGPPPPASPPPHW